MTSISLKKLGSNSAGFSPDPSKVTLLRFSTLIPPPITMAPHDGGLPLTLSYALADNDPTLPSLPRKHTAQILRERCLWGSWGRTKWEATQTQSIAIARRGSLCFHQRTTKHSLPKWNHSMTQNYNMIFTRIWTKMVYTSLLLANSAGPKPIIPPDAARLCHRSTW